MKTEMIYEGKAKKVYATEDPALVIVSYKDDATAGDGAKKGTIVGKGVINNRMSNHMMRILALGYIAMGVSQCLSGVMRGAGDTMTPMWISIITTIVIRIPIAYLLAYLTRSDEYPVGRPESLFISLLISWLLGMVINWIAYRRGKWKTKGLTTGQA